MEKSLSIETNKIKITSETSTGFNSSPPSPATKKK